MQYDILESDFDKSLSTSYQLSILAGKDNLTYFAFDTGAHQALLLKSVPFAEQGNGQAEKELKQIFGREELLAYLFRRVKIILPESTALLVPDRLFNEAEKGAYYQEMTGTPDDQLIEYNEVPELSLRVLYPFDDFLGGIFKKQFPTARFYNRATPLLAGLRKMTGEGAQQSYYAHFTADTLHLALFDRQNLLFYNSYPFHAAGDVLYYIMLIYNQYALPPASLPLYLSGQILEHSEIYKMLYRYIGELRFLPEPSFLKFGKRFSDVPAWLYFDLYALATCK